MGAETYHQALSRETHSWRFLSGPSLWSSGSTPHPRKRGRRNCGSKRIWPRRAWPTEATKQGSWRFTDTEAANTGPVLVWARSCACMLWLLVWCFVGREELLTLGLGMSLTLLPAFGTLFLLLGYLMQPWWEYVLSLLITYDTFSWYPWEACIFFKKKRNGSGSGRGGRYGKTERRRWGQSWRKKNQLTIVREQQACWLEQQTESSHFKLQAGSRVN